MESPLPYDDQDDEIKSQFVRLFRAIFNSIKFNSSKEDVRAFNQLVQREITAKPILARIVRGNYSILSVACVQGNKLVHSAIKCLIEAYPSALLWETHSVIGERMICNIANHPSHCVLMPWIAINHQWVLDHDICLKDPPVFPLLYQYANRGEETKCTAEIIQQFFEAYPQGLMQVSEDRYTPLHAIVEGSVECEPDLFKWMAERCPSSMLNETGRARCTPLHRACDSLARHLGDNSSEICKYLIAKCPESARILLGSDTLPIHRLLSHCQHRVIKEVVVCLLRANPESNDMVSEFTAAPSSTPFVRRIKPLLDEEKEMKENVAYLEDMSGVFRDAVDGTQTPRSLATSTCEFLLDAVDNTNTSLASSTCDAFGNWATAFIQLLEANIEQVSTQLQHECNVDEERFLFEYSE